MGDCYSCYEQKTQTSVSSHQQELRLIFQHAMRNEGAVHAVFLCLFPEKGLDLDCLGTWFCCR